MVDRWNARVAPNDLVFHLGDVAMCKDAAFYVQQLNGHKFLIRGNHDGHSKSKNREWGFIDSVDEMFVRVDGVIFWMAHVPDGPDYNGRQLRRPKRSQPYDIALCGHVHDKWLFKDRTVNVGVDQWDFKPITAQEIVSRCGDKVRKT
jgi:calcineurin-like phosphoesterase family protein